MITGTVTPIRRVAGPGNNPLAAAIAESNQRGQRIVTLENELARTRAALAAATDRVAELDGDRVTRLLAVTRSEHAKTYTALRIAYRALVKVHSDLAAKPKRKPDVAALGEAVARVGRTVNGVDEPTPGD